MRRSTDGNAHERASACCFADASVLTALGQRPGLRFVGGSDRSIGGTTPRTRPWRAVARIESIDPWCFTWDGTADGWPSVDAARERIRQGPPRLGIDAP